MSIVHETPGLIDIRSFTTFGLHAKPNSDTPIGKFGTGLKYAVATLLRLGCTIRVFIGLEEYEFFTSDGLFRGQNFKQCKMRKRRSILKKWTYQELPFTTDHGKFWEAWQAFRELESNTRDEGGKTWIDDGEGGGAQYLISNLAHPDKTLIAVEGLVYEQAYKDRDEIFLPNALTQREGDDKVQVFNEPSKFIYWRGIRVFDLEKPSIYTYNILEEMTLTEDRTLKYVWEAQSKIAAYVARSKDRKLINTVVSADDKFFEHRVEFDYSYVSPSEEFNEVVAKKRSRGSYVSPRASTYYEKYSPPVVKESVRTLQQKIEDFSYDNNLPEDVRELFKYLLRCEIKEPEKQDPDYMPF